VFVVAIVLFMRDMMMGEVNQLPVVVSAVVLVVIKKIKKKKNEEVEGL